MTLVVVAIWGLSAANVFAQNEVTGTVTDGSTSETLPGVNILVKGTTQGTSTDADGNFQLQVPSLSDTLVFSFVGYQSQEVSINGRTEINVTLQPQTLVGEDIVVVGYGTQQREDLTGSIASADVESMNRVATQSLANALDGQVTGVRVQTSGAPGEEPAINVRGIGSFGANEPLYVVDGIQVPDIIDFDPAQFESVQVLKDAAASAIYGSRAANGVVVIETQKGRADDFQVSYKGTYGTENVYQRIDMLEREQFQEIINESLRNVGEPISSASANDPDSPQFINDINTNWQEEAWERGYSTKQNLTVSGGNEHSVYSIGGSYENNTGTFSGDAPSYERVTARVNSDHDIGRITIGENVWLTRSINLPQTSILNNGVSLVNETLQSLPIIPVRDPNRLGGFAGPTAGVEQGIAMNTIGVNHLMEREQDVNRAFVNLWGDVDILENLTYKLNLAYDSRNFKETWFQPTFNLGFFFVEQEGELQITSNETIGTTIENTLNYVTNIQSHEFDVLAGFSQEENRIEQEFSAGTGYNRPFVKVINGAESTRSSGIESNNALRSYFARLQYNFDDRYLATASYRRDGSSRFGENNKWGNFPSFSVGWRISNEQFFSGINWINELKLRASWGKIGNQEIGNYAAIPVINNFANYNFNDQVIPGSIQVSLVNEDLKWEVLTSRTIGIDTRFLDNKFNLTVEYFNNDSEDILVSVPLPGTIGSASNPVANAATVNNSGVEITTGYSDTFGAFDVDVHANIATLTNEVESLGGQGEPIFGAASKTDVGHEIGELFGYVTDGIFQNQQEVDDHATQEPGTAAGDIRFRDLNGDGIINSDDRTYLGSPTPDFTYGVGTSLNYRAFDASLFFKGNYGNKIYNGQRQIVEDMGDYNNQSVRVYENRWMSENMHNNAQFPRAAWGDPNSNNRSSDRFVEDGSYLRLQNVTIGYTIPVNNKFGIQNLRTFMTAQNLFTLTGYSGLDPELGTGGGTTENSASVTNITNDGLFSRGFDDGAWPNPRIFQIGVELEL